MYRFRRLAIAMFIFLVGIGLLPFVSLPAEAFSWELFANAYEDGPTLVINHNSGRPGSFFEVKGDNFPANATATITINGTTLGTVPTDSAGAIEFELNTTGLDPTGDDDGAYFVTGTVNPSATVRFDIDSSAPDTWPSVGTTPVFPVPPGIAFTRFIYLPIILR